MSVRRWSASTVRRSSSRSGRAADPSVDCFYVYPTVSREHAGNASMTLGPEEVRVVEQQLARFGSVCRLLRAALSPSDAAGATWPRTSSATGAPLRTTSAHTATCATRGTTIFGTTTTAAAWSSSSATRKAPRSWSSWWPMPSRARPHKSSCCRSSWAADTCRFPSENRWVATSGRCRCASARGSSGAPSILRRFAPTARRRQMRASAGRSARGWKPRASIRRSSTGRPVRWAPICRR